MLDVQKAYVLIVMKNFRGHRCKNKQFLLTSPGWRFQPKLRKHRRWPLPLNWHHTTYSLGFYHSPWNNIHRNIPWPIPLIPSSPFWPTFPSHSPVLCTHPRPLSFSTCWHRELSQYYTTQGSSIFTFNHSILTLVFSHGWKWWTPKMWWPMF